MDTLASLIVKIGADISGYTEGLNQATTQLGTLTDSISGMGEKLAELGAEFLTFEGLKEFGEECVTVAADIEKASVAITHLTGSATAANEVIRQMEELAKDDAIGFPELLPAAQRFIAVGMAVDEIKPAMDAAANASWALGESVDGIAGKMEGMALSGMASGRQLKALGLSSEDMAKVLGVSASEVANAFKGLDSDMRLEALTLGMQKFGGTAAEEAKKTAGGWIEVKNTWHEVFATLGESAQPTTTFLEAVAVVTGEIAKNVANTNYKTLFSGSSGSVSHAQLPETGTTGPTSTLDQIQESVKATQAANDLAYALAHQTTELQDAQAALGLVTAAFRDHLASSLDVYRATEAVTEAFAAANPQFTGFVSASDKAAVAGQLLAHTLDQIELTKGVNFELWVDQFERGDQELPPLVQSVKNMQQGLADVDAWAKQSAASLNYEGEAMKALGLSVEGGTKALHEFEIIADSLGKGADLQNVEDAWAKVSGQINKLAESDLPKAIAEYDKYIATLQAENAPIGQIFDAQSKELELEIKINAERGEGANAQIVALTNIQTHMQAQVELANTLGNAYKGLQKDFDNAFSTLSKNVSSAIVNATSFGAAWKATVKTVEQSILETIIGAAFGALKDAIILVIDKIFGIGVATQAVSATTQAAASVLDSAQVVGQAAIGGASVAAWMAADPFTAPGAVAAGVAMEAAIDAAFLPEASFDKGGWVPDDMVANIHKGEYIIPAAAASSMVSNSSSFSSQQPVTINVHADRNPMVTAQKITQALKTLSPKFANSAA